MHFFLLCGLALAKAYVPSMQRRLIDALSSIRVHLPPGQIRLQDSRTLCIEANAYLQTVFHDEPEFRPTLRQLRHHCEHLHQPTSALTQHFNLMLFGRFGIPGNTVTSNLRLTHNYLATYAIGQEDTPPPIAFIKDISLQHLLIELSSGIITPPVYTTFMLLVSQGWLLPSINPGSLDRTELQPRDVLHKLHFARQHQVRLVLNASLYNRYDLQIHQDGHIYTAFSRSAFIENNRNNRTFAPHLCLFPAGIRTQDIQEFLVETDEDKRTLQSITPYNLPITIISPSITTTRSGRME